jgi:hypothetical protein
LDTNIVHCAHRLRYLNETNDIIAGDFDTHTKKAIALIIETSPNIFFPPRTTTENTKESVQEDLEYLAEAMVRQALRTLPS